jgi:hypothetical protein
MENSVEPYSTARLTRRIVILALLCFTEGAQAQYLELEKEILQTIADHAERICGTVPLEGSSGNVELSGSAKMELDGLLKKMTAMGIQGTATYQGSQYQGLLQKDLLTAMRDKTNCKMSVNNVLMGKLLAAAVASREPLKLSVNISQATTGVQAPYETKFVVTVNQIYTPVRLLVQCDEEIVDAHGSLLGAAVSMSGGWGGRFSKNRFGIGILAPAWAPATPLVVTVKSNANPLGTCQFVPQ